MLLYFQELVEYQKFIFSYSPASINYLCLQRKLITVNLIINQSDINFDIIVIACWMCELDCIRDYVEESLLVESPFC